jgi:hypothetical protein
LGETQREQAWAEIERQLAQLEGRHRGPWRVPHRSRNQVGDKVMALLKNI